MAAVAWARVGNVFGVGVGQAANGQSSKLLPSPRRICAMASLVGGERWTGRACVSVSLDRAAAHPAIKGGAAITMLIASDVKRRRRLTVPPASQ